jgi:hypothetical protein
VVFAFFLHNTATVAALAETFYHEKTASASTRLLNIHSYKILTIGTLPLGTLPRQFDHQKGLFPLKTAFGIQFIITHMAAFGAIRR